MEMWERITVALAELGPAALALSEEEAGTGEPPSEEALVDYEGMLISVAAAQRRRCGCLVGVLNGRHKSAAALRVLQKSPFRLAS